jgi:hypothetical protein
MSRLAMVRDEVALEERGAGCEIARERAADEVARAIGRQANAGPQGDDVAWLDAVP